MFRVSFQTLHGDVGSEVSLILPSGKMQSFSKKEEKFDFTEKLSLKRVCAFNSKGLSLISMWKQKMEKIEQRHSLYMLEQ